jgi:hypothetical protein
VGSGSTDTYALEALRPLLTLIESIDSKRGATDVQAAGRPSVVGTQLCRDCQSPLPLVEPPKNRPGDLSLQPKQSPPAPIEGSAAAHELLPKFHAENSEILAQSHSLTQRLEAREKLLQQRADEHQPTVKAAKDEPARSETTSLPQNARQVPLTPSTEPESSQAYKLPKSPPGSDSKGKSPSTRSSFRARLFGRAASSAGTVHSKA